MLRTRQELFEASITGIISQGGRSSKSGFSAYVGDEHKGCAFGVLFTDDVRHEILNQNLNHASIKSLIMIRLFRNTKLNQFFIDNPVFMNDTSLSLVFMENLQALHDNALNWKSKSAMLEVILEFSKEFNLDDKFVYSLDWSNFEKNTC